MAPSVFQALGWGMALVALGTGCQRKEIPRPDQRPNAVTVQSVGAEPRLKLRYRYRAGESLTYRITSHREISGLPRPAGPVAVTLSVFTDRVRGRRARLRWRVERVASGSARLQGLDLWVETSDRGEISTVSRGRPRPRSRPRPKPSGQVQQSVRRLYLAWPAEAVGPGAWWIQRRDVILAPSTHGGFRARVAARYRFDRVAPCGRGRCAHLSMRLTMDLSHKAGLVKVRGKGRGSGRVVFDLERGRLLESHTRAVIGLSTSLMPNKVVQRLSLNQSMVMTR